MDRPLKDVKVLDLSRVMAGPFCTMVLADLGAEVIKVEPPEGDDSRRFTPIVDGESAYFASVNRNKKSVVVDLKRPSGQEVVRRLARRSDVVIENFRPGVAKRLGVSYEDLSSLNPSLIYCSITGFGQTGIYSQKPGYDLIALAMSGMMDLTGEPEGEPVKFAVPIADIAAGTFAAISILAALIERSRTGRGAYIDVSMLDVMLYLLTHQASAFLLAGEVPRRMGSAHPSIVPYQAFRASDGYVIVAVANEPQWQRLCAALGVPELAEDEKFRTNGDRVRNRTQLLDILGPIFAKRTVAEWVADLERADVPVAPVRSVREALTDPYVDERGMVERVRHPTLGEVALLAFPVVVSGLRPRVRSPPPTLGQHTGEVLRSLGYTEVEIEALRREGAVK
ncbi:MAG: CoA transferase [Thaumarchaeota archaeon]|nr:CoA transferase [Candidatus Calditenuaceae archaeon]MDW8043505.1 CaiB/BaiF CoA-transferase family protein [Nitrososphaerota archaeon]